MPFENSSRAPGIDWISESFPDVLASRMNSASLLIVSRDERTYALDRLGIPATAKPSRATIYEMAQQIDADYAIVGRYTFDGSTFTASAHVMDLGRLRLSPELTESGPLTSLISIQTALAWDALHALGISPDAAANSKEQFLSRFPLIRLDSLENYIRGILAAGEQEKIKYFKEALRLEPNHALAMLQLAKTYYNAREYEPAVSWFSRVPQDDPGANESHFYLGLAAYYGGQWEKSEAAFQWLAIHLPLTEVLNNLGVVAARRGEKRAREYFEKSIRTDPSDPDYHFNLAVELYRGGDAAEAARQLRESLALRPDAEAKSFLEALGAKEERASPPLERVKVNYDESSFRQLSMEIENAGEARFRQMDPATHAAHHVQRGQELLAQELAGEAEKQFREAVALDPANAEAHAGLSEALESGQQADEARVQALAALALKPVVQAYLVLARLDWSGHHPASAEQYIEKALALDPANAAAASLRQEITATPRGRPKLQP